MHDLGQSIGSLRTENNARFSDMNSIMTSLRGEMNSRFAEVYNRINTLTAIVVGAWITTIIAIVGLYFAR